MNEIRPWLYVGKYRDTPEDLPLLAAWQEVKQRHPEALPHMALWDSLCRYYDEPIPFSQIFETP